jgi:hypothetical protein
MGAENLASTGIRFQDHPAHSDYAIPAFKEVTIMDDILK